MPVVKDEQDLLALRAYACSGNSKFFLGTDSAPHHISYKIPNMNSKPGIFFIFKYFFPNIPSGHINKSL